MERFKFKTRGLRDICIRDLFFEFLEHKEEKDWSDPQPDSAIQPKARGLLHMEREYFAHHIWSRFQGLSTSQPRCNCRCYKRGKVHPSLKSKSLLLRVAPECRFGIKDLSRGIRFYPSDYLQDSSDSESEKTSFSGKIPEKRYNWIRHTDCTRNNFRNKTRDVRLFIQCSHEMLLFRESALL